LGLRTGAIVLAVCFVAAAAGCSSPFSEFQSARLAGRGEAEVTAHYSTMGISGEFVQDHVGVQAGFGVTNSVDIRARYERLWVEGLDAEYLDVFGFGPKISMHPDQAAFYLPVGFAFGSDVESSKTWEAHPTVLTTYTVNPNLDFNLSIKVLLSLNNDSGYNTRLAVNFGFGIGPESLTYTFHPEAGFMVYTEGGDPFYHVGLGISLSTTDKKRVRAATGP
jgi:hypothetical protein